MRPELIVFDEATAMLDPVGRTDILHTMRELQKEGLGIVLITHHMQEAIQADRVVLMDKGSIVAEGTPREIFSSIDLLHNLHLDAPVVAEIAARLYDESLLPRKGILSIAELVDEICRLSPEA
jgi:energy-coupling factor transport system ATP-binding protein